MQECIVQRGLTLVRGDQLGRGAPTARVPSLAAQPFRPGELPEAVAIELPDAVAADAEERAARAGVPTELWLRLAVEAVRHVDRLADALDTPALDLIANLDSAADEASTVAPLETRRQRAYAQHLRAASSRTSPHAKCLRFSLALPDHVLAAWSIDATIATATISDYVASAVARVPPRVVEWEAAAAERGQLLGEWVYAEGVCSIRRR